MRVTNTTILRATGLLTLMLVSTLLGGIVGCSGEPDPTNATDSYEMFRDGLFAGDAEAMWERTDEATRNYFEDRYERLVEMDELIERYLPQTDHALARTQSGTELLEEVDSGRQLFIEMIEPGEFSDDAAVRLGSGIRELQMAEDGTSAVAVTRGGQEFVLVQADDDHWYINLVESGDFVDETFAWLIENEDALEQTVENLMEEERQVREQIIADLMDPDEE